MVRRARVDVALGKLLGRERARQERRADGAARRVGRADRVLEALAEARAAERRRDARLALEQRVKARAYGLFYLERGVEEGWCGGVQLCVWGRRWRCGDIGQSKDAKQAGGAEGIGAKKE